AAFPSPAQAPPAVSVTAETGFPGDPLAAQTPLHQAIAELAALLRALPSTPCRTKRRGGRGGGRENTEAKAKTVVNAP
ncbi:hypothetical protein, partial [Streptomyces sp. NPDC050804]|uniref:hypothetical protein n=1 Tax=Streptomyces sp. NPDC050804 TaxID=3154745 RepID=UPI00341E5F4E